jgi:hypothetical protein
MHFARENFVIAGSRVPSRTLFTMFSRDGDTGATRRRNRLGKRWKEFIHYVCKK